jgi:hypothetical protein
MSLSGVCVLNSFRSPAGEKERTSQAPIVALRYPWSQLEPLNGRVSANSILRDLDAIESWGKTATIRIAGGIFSPDWMLRASDEYGRNVPYQQHKRDGWLPIPYSRIYIERWVAMLEQVGAEIRHHPVIRMVHMCGPADGGEMDLVKPNEQVSPPVLPYYKETVQRAWDQVIPVYMSLFDAPMELSLSIVPPYKNDGLLQDILDQYDLDSSLAIQNNSLWSGSSATWFVHELIRDWPHNTGYQLLGGPDKVGDVAAAVAFAQSQGVHYLEALPGVIESHYDILSMIS